MREGSCSGSGWPCSSKAPSFVSTDDEADHANKSGGTEGLLEPDQMPTDDVLYKLIDKIEAQLPKDDVVKYDSRCVANWIIITRCLLYNTIHLQCYFIFAE